MSSDKKDALIRTVRYAPDAEQKARGEEGAIHGYMAWCPGCREYHEFDVKRWSFNGNFEKPTFSPSMLVRRPGHETLACCHSFLVDGEWRFLTDTTHHLAGRNVPLTPEPPEESDGALP